MSIIFPQLAAQRQTSRNKTSQAINLYLFLDIIPVPPYLWYNNFNFKFISRRHNRPFQAHFIFYLFFTLRYFTYALRRRENLCFRVYHKTAPEKRKNWNLAEI
jgi:hypothetical protein